ncbi:uncharacterized protein LOC143292531 [Babylonia areolata]|uniref:uncharacterized protein LOC143292531 n=1 Tax=Babylonia areolata TaxID=304850 RepID=UPI003FD524B0
MASDDEDLIALREAALATMKKKPAAAEDAQPIPQLTSSGHCLSNVKPPWTEDDFTYEDHLPFQDEPATPFPPLSTAPRPQFTQPPPTQFPPNNWPGPRPGIGPVPRGNFRFGRNRGPFPRNQRPPFRHNQRPLFGQRMPFLANQRQPFPVNQRLPFNPNQPRPPFGQNPLQFIGGPPAGGGGNLIVINTVPEGGEQAPELRGQRPPFPGPPFPGVVNPRGRGGGPMGVGRGGGGGGGDAGRGGNLPPVESSSKPMLLRPQDKYCPPAEPSSVVKEEHKERVHRKKKDKFSRYNSSDDDSDDESEEESEDDMPSRRRSVGGIETEEKETAGPEDVNEGLALQNPSEKSIPDADLSIVCNTSQLDSDHERAEPELEEPVIDSLGEQVIDSLGDEPVTDRPGDSGHVSEPELNEEEENRLLASPSRQSDSGSDCGGRWGRRRHSSDNDETPVRDESPLRGESPVKDEPLEKEVTPEGSPTPVRDESFDNGADATPVRDESPERDLSPEQAESPEEDSDQDKSPSGLQVQRGETSVQSGESDSGSNSESGDESDSSSGAASSASSSGNEVDSQKSSNSASEDSETNKLAESPSDKDSNADDGQVSDVVSESESDEDRSVQRLPSKHRLSTSSRQKRSQSPSKSKVVTPEEQARMDARKRKFQDRQEVKVTSSKRTISLKAISSGAERSNDSKRENRLAVKDSSSTKSNFRTVQAKTSVTKSNDVDFHRKHSRRKVSIENPILGKSNSNNSGAGNSSDSQGEEDDDDEGGSRSWRREANRNTVHRKTVVNQSLPGSGSYRGQSFRGGNRNGGYYRRERESPKDSRPEVHYSSSDNDDQDSDRKLISVVVPRSAAGTHHRGYSHPRQEQTVARSVVPNRKRTPDMAKFDRESDRHSHSKSKRLPDFNPSSDRSGSINVVIASDRSSSKVSQSSRDRVPVHQRLGKNSKQHTEVPRSRSSTRPAARNQSDSASGNEGNGNDELDQRIRRIQKRNKAIMRRQKEVLKDRELYG